MIKRKLIWFSSSQEVLKWRAGNEVWRENPNTDKRWVRVTDVFASLWMKFFLNHFKNNIKFLLAVVYWVAGKSSDAQTISLEMMAIVPISNPQKIFILLLNFPPITSCFLFHHRCYCFNPWNSLI